MRLLSALFACLGALALAAAAPPAKDWRQMTGIAPATGGFTVGNPAAKVKLVEYLSYTCPHCGHFVEQSRSVLHDTMVRDGTVAIETRSAARDPYDLAAWVMARCGGPARFSTLSPAIFAAQEAWMNKGNDYVQANLEKVEALPQRQQLRLILDQSGLAAIGARAGVTPAALNTCLASDKQVDAILKMTQAAFAKIPGTPGFEINGTVVEGADWASLEPKLRAAGAH